MNKNIINQIENVRKKNNRNWMNLLRIAFEHAPKETASSYEKNKYC